MYKQAPTTAAVTYLLNTAEYNKDVTVTVIGALDTGETIDFLCPLSGSATNVNLYVDDVQVQITPTNSMVRLSGSAEILISKGTTASVVGFRIA